MLGGFTEDHDQGRTHRRNCQNAKHDTFADDFGTRAAILAVQGPSESRDLEAQLLKTYPNILKLVGITELELLEVEVFHEIYFSQHSHRRNPKLKIDVEEV